MYFIGHMGYFGWFGMVIFWVAIIGFVIWLTNKNNNQQSSNKQDPMQILKTRYAKGEITKKELNEMKKEL